MSAPTEPPASASSRAPRSAGPKPPVGRIVLTVLGLLLLIPAVALTVDRQHPAVGPRDPARLRRLLHQRHRAVRDADLRDRV